MRINIMNDILTKTKRKSPDGISTNDLIFSAYSRKDEFAADLLGIKYMSLARYDLDGATRAVEILKKESKGNEGLLLLKSHPYLEDRIKRIEEEKGKIALQYQE